MNVQDDARMARPTPIDLHGRLKTSANAEGWFALGASLTSPSHDLTYLGYFSRPNLIRYFITYIRHNVLSASSTTHQYATRTLTVYAYDLPSHLRLTPNNLTLLEAWRNLPAWRMAESVRKRSRLLLPTARKLLIGLPEVSPQTIVI